MTDNVAFRQVSFLMCDGATMYGTLPTIETQRQTLRSLALHSPRRYRILYLATSPWGEGDIVASLFHALERLGHVVLHVDPYKGALCRDPPSTDKGRGSVYVDLKQIQHILERFEPQIVMCVAGGLCFSPMDAEQIKKQGLVLAGTTLSDPGFQESVMKHAGDFDFHTTNSPRALAEYRVQGLRNTFLLPFGIDRDNAVANVPGRPDMPADVICLGHARGRPQLNQLMLEVAKHVRGLRVYGEGWELPSATVSNRLQHMPAGDAGIIHIHFAQTRDGYTNVERGVLESVASGAVVCTEYSDEIRELFEYDAEIIGFRDAEDLVGAIKELLANPDKAEMIRRRAFARLARSHLCEHRWLSLFAQVEREVFIGGGCVSVERAAACRLVLDRVACEKRRVVVTGYFGADNAGDELILRATVENLATGDSPLEIVVAGENAQRVTCLHGLLAFARRDLVRGYSEVSAATAVILGGGGLWHDYTFASSGGLLGLFNDNAMSLTGYAKLPILARMLGRSVHVFGVGVGPLQNDEAKKFLRFFADQAESISVRDRKSMQLLLGIDGWKFPIKVIPDPVFAVNLGVRMVPDAVKTLQDQAWKVLALNLRPWKGEKCDVLFKNLAAALEKLTRRHKIALVGVPMQRGRDEVVLEELFASLRTQAPRLVLRPAGPHWLNEIFGVLASSEAVVAMRLHASILAHRFRKPAVGICYDPKVHSHFEDVGIASCGLPLTASCAEMEQAIEAAIVKDGKLEKDTADKIVELERLAVASFKDMARMLSAAPTVRASVVSSVESVVRQAVAPQ